MAREIWAKLTVEECSHSSKVYDEERQYVVHVRHILAEGEIYITSKPSKLEENLRMIFKTDQVPKTGSSYYSSSSSSYYSSDPAKRRERRFLTRDPIYAPPNKETGEQLKELGRTVMGRQPGDGFDILCDIVDEMISPPKRTL